MLKLYIKIKRRCYRFFNLIFLKSYGVSVGHNVIVHDKVYFQIDKQSKVTIGNDFYFSSGGGYNPICRNIRGEICVRDGAYLKIGDNVGVSSACIWAECGITIGNNVRIGGGTIIIDTDSHNLDYQKRRARVEEKSTIVKKEIHIGDDVWIGANSIILKGVHIGNRTIIGAGSVVTKNIPSDCVAGGNPCKIIRYIDNGII